MLCHTTYPAEAAASELLKPGLVQPLVGIKANRGVGWLLLPHKGQWGSAGVCRPGQAARSVSQIFSVVRSNKVVAALS